MVTKDIERDSNQIESAPLSGGSKLGTLDIDAEKIFFIILSKWPLIILSVLLSFFLSNLYLRYVTPKYSAVTKLLIKDTRASGGMSEAVVFQDLGILNSGRNLDNEIQILRTTFLFEEVIKRLNLQYSYESQGRLKTREYYNDAPVRILSWEPNDSSNQRSFSIEVSLKSNDKFTISLNEKTYTGSYGEAIKIPYGRLTLGTPEYDKRTKNSETRQVAIKISPTNIAAIEFGRNLNVNVDQKSRSTVLELTYIDQIPDRAEDILKTIIDVYNETEIADKNRIYENTVRFIDERMDILGDELRAVEGDVASFRSRTGTIDLGGEGAMLLSASAESAKLLAEINTQLEIARDIRQSLSVEPGNFTYVPTSAFLISPAIFNLLSTFNQLLLERDNLKTKLGPNHPDIITIEKQLANLRTNIIENTNTIERDLLVKKNSLNVQDKEITKRMRVLPSTEKQLLEIQRQQVIKQELYLYLLQKREESALSLSVTVANNRVIEPPKFNGKVSPKVKQIQLFAISFGFLAPILLLLLWNAMNKKVMIEDHIANNTLTPILGTIPFIENQGSIVISEGKRSAAAEMFRLLRANFQFVGEGINNRVIAFTSSISGEGKSFICLNMGFTLALGNKKVVLIELDMRKPKLAKYMGFAKGSGKGVTDYLVDANSSWKEIIHVSEQSPNLHFIPCGPLPPNPSELLLGDQLKILIEELKNSYDYVLIDTPPIGLVSDSLLLNRIVDATFFIVRQGVTEQRQLKIVDEIARNKKMPRVYIIFNGVKFGSGGYGYGTGYGYGYGYNYGYGYGYYADDKKHLPKWKRILGIRK